MVQQLYAVNTKPSLAKAILQAGLIGGTLDALYAITSFTLSTHRNPVIIFWSIASGVFRNEPPIPAMLNADAGTQFMYAAAGVLLHYFIAFSFITFLFFVYKPFKKILGTNIVVALVYGCLVWLVMNYIVLPITFNGQMPKYNWKTILSVLYLVTAIGLVGSLWAARFYKKAGLA